MSFLVSMIPHNAHGLSAAISTKSVRMEAVTRTPEEFSDYELERSKLRHDIDTVRRYGEAHPDEWTEVLIENEPGVRIVALVAGRLDYHAKALRELVEYPDQLEVRFTEFSLVRLELMKQAVHEMAMANPGSFLSWGIGSGRLYVHVAADQVTLASTLVDKFGDAIVVRVGAFPFPDISEIRVGPRTGSDEVRPIVPLVSPMELKVSSVDELVIESGRTVHGSLRFLNLGSDDVVLATNGALTARVIDPSTGEVVGGFVGAQAMPLIHYSIAAGGTTEVPVVVGTASFNVDLGYAVPPGEWTIDVLLEIRERGVRRIPPIPITITEYSG